MRELKMRIDVTFHVEDETELRDASFLSQVSEGTLSEKLGLSQADRAWVVAAGRDDVVSQLLLDRLMPVMSSIAEDAPGLAPGFNMTIGDADG